jgi:hypothetical protein
MVVVDLVLLVVMPPQTELVEEVEDPVTLTVL